VIVHAPAASGLAHPQAAHARRRDDRVMTTFILATRLAPQALHQPRSYTTLEQHVADQVRQHCPDVQWLHSWAVLGPWDYLDVIEADSIESATRVSVLVRSHGRAQAEVWPAMPWPEFKALVRSLAAA
jgi:uncharacterized protein with GYD domain